MVEQRVNSSQEPSFKLPFEVIKSIAETHIPPYHTGEFEFSYFTEFYSRSWGTGVQRNIDKYSFVSLAHFSYNDRIEIPVRGITCAHLDVCDLKYLVSYIASSNKWECPICKNKIFLGGIYVDQTINNLIQSSNNIMEDLIYIEKETKEINITQSAQPMPGPLAQVTSDSVINASKKYPSFGISTSSIKYNPSRSSLEIQFINLEKNVSMKIIKKKESACLFTFILFNQFEIITSKQLIDRQTYIDRTGVQAYDLYLSESDQSESIFPNIETILTYDICIKMSTVPFIIISDYNIAMPSLRNIKSLLLKKHSRFYVFYIHSKGDPIRSKREFLEIARIFDIKEEISERQFMGEKSFSLPLPVDGQLFYAYEKSDVYPKIAEFKTDILNTLSKMNKFDEKYLLHNTIKEKFKDFFKEYMAGAQSYKNIQCSLIDSELRFMIRMNPYDEIITSTITISTEPNYITIMIPENGLNPKPHYRPLHIYMTHFLPQLHPQILSRENLSDAIFRFITIQPNSEFGNPQIIVNIIKELADVMIIDFLRESVSFKNIMKRPGAPLPTCIFLYESEDRQYDIESFKSKLRKEGYPDWLLGDLLPDSFRENSKMYLAGTNMKYIFLPKDNEGQKYLENILKTIKLNNNHKNITRDYIQQTLKAIANQEDKMILNLQEQKTLFGTLFRIKDF